MKIATSLLVLSGMIMMIMFAPSSAFYYSSVSCGRSSTLLQQVASTTTTTTTDHKVGAFTTTTTQQLLLSQYMTKAHEAKLQAVHDAEAKKQMEIDALKQEIARLQAAAAAAAASKTITYRERLMALSKEELVERILQYREFTSEYIIKAHEDKFNAVQAAKKAAITTSSSQQQAPGVSAAAAAAPTSSSSSTTATATTVSASTPAEKASTSTGTSTTSSSISSFSPSKSAVPNPLFTARNAAVATAGTDSRWGELEVKRAVAARGTTTAAAGKTTVSIAADPTEPLLFFAARNKMIAAAGTKSRWGPLEVQRVTQGVLKGAAPTTLMTTMTTTTPTTRTPVLTNIGATVAAAAAAAETVNGTPAAVAASTMANGLVTFTTPPLEVVAADHGLRADGGVGGLTLAERVAMGAAAPAAANDKSMPPPTPASSSGQQQKHQHHQHQYHHRGSYQERNEMLLAASQAGKSRWSADEVSRIQTKVGKLPSIAVKNRSEHHDDTVINGVAAKVGKLSLHERINLGAAMLAH